MTRNKLPEGYGSLAIEKNSSSGWDSHKLSVDNFVVRADNPPAEKTDHSSVFIQPLPSTKVSHVNISPESGAVEQDEKMPQPNSASPGMLSHFMDRSIEKEKRRNE